MNQTSVATEPINLRDTARAWLEYTLRTHLHPELAAGDRIKHVAAAIEDDANERDMPIEMAVSLAVEWCENQNEEAGLSQNG